MGIIRPIEHLSVGRFGYRLTPGKIQIAKDVEAYIRARTYDLFVVDEIFRRQVYNPDDRFDIKNPELIVDLGANIGLFALWAFQKYNPKKIVCVEPDPENLELLEQNIAINGLTSRIKIIEGAVAAKDGKAGMHKKPINRGGHYLIEDTTQNPVDTFTLGSVINTAGHDVDFLKMDIEGSESQVLTPENAALFDKVDYLHMEVHETAQAQRNLGEVALYFANLGFQTLEHPVPLILRKSKNAVCLYGRIEASK